MAETIPPPPAAAASAGPSRRTRDRRAALGSVFVGIPLLAVVVTVVVMGPSGYESLHRPVPDLVTSLISGLLRVVAECAGSVTVGALFFAAFIRARSGARRLVIDNGRDLSTVRWASLLWALSATSLAAVDAADASGQSLDRLLEPGSLAYLMSASYLPGAWVVAAVVAWTIYLMANFLGTWQPLLIMLALSILAVLAPVVVGQVLVGPQHDFGGDAAIIGTPATTILTGLVFLVAWAAARGDALGAVEALRLRWTAVVTGVIAAGTQTIIAAFMLAGSAPWESATGWLFLVRFALLGALGVLGWRATRPAAAPQHSTWTITALAALLLSAHLGITSAMTRIPPPQYFVPTSVDQVFLGYDVDSEPSPLVLLLEWRPNILFAVLTAAGIGLYLWGVRRLRQRGDAWPVGRTVAWVLGWATVFLTTSSGLGRYSSVSFSLHMILHMSLNMLGPLLLVMGGVVTLALRASTAHRRNEPAGVHEWITAMLNWRLTHAFYHPIHVFVSFVGTYYLLYLTPIFGEALRYHWSHQLMNLDFLIIGYVFYSLVIGVDHPPRPLPHIGKLGLVLAAMPFHAFFGVVIMSSETVIARNYYEYIGKWWMTDLAHDQYVGGGIAWAAGELPLIAVVIALVTQWSRQDSRRAKRVDRHLDSGIDDSFEAYNDMLNRLSGRSTTPSGTPETTATAERVPEMKDQT